MSTKYSYLSGDKHSVHPDWHHGTTLILVFNSDLGFPIRSKPSATIVSNLVNCSTSLKTFIFSNLRYAFIFHKMLNFQHAGSFSTTTNCSDIEYLNKS